MNQTSSCVAVYPSFAEEDDQLIQVINNLLSNNISSNKLSVIGKGSEQGDHTIGIYKVLDEIKYKGEQNEFWHALWELLSGEAFFLIPEFGSLAVAGELSSLMQVPFDEDSTELLDANNFTELGKVLFRIGIPEYSIIQYEAILKSGQLILIIHGNNQEIEEAGNLLEYTQNMDISLHFTNT